MPADRSHEFVATVTDSEGQAVLGAGVSFSTDEGGFSYSGVDPKYIEETTDAQGHASVSLFGTRPGTAAIRAWLDYDGDNVWDANEASATASKTWAFFGPYITVSSHQVYPLDTIEIYVVDHNPSSNPHRLLWCVVSGTTPSGVVMDPLNVDSGGDEIVPFDIPEASEGSLYRLETHSGSGNCGAEGDLVAFSADVQVVEVPPDLTIASFDVPGLICPETVFTMSAVIQNLTQGSTDETFDVDFYVDPEYTPPQSIIGVTKQWVSGIDREETITVNTLMWLDSPGEHVIWARVDTSNYVDEGDGNEDNNIDVITVTVSSGAALEEVTGWHSPAADASDSGGDGDGFERNPGNAYADGGGYAESRDNGVPGGGPWDPPADPTERHRYYDFNFNIPSDATIQGIEVRLDWWLDNTSGSNRMDVELSWDGGTHWTSAKTDSQETTSQHTVVLGGSEDGWGKSTPWTPAHFSNGNFRVRLSTTSSSENRDFYLDWVAVQVTYVGSGECPGIHEDPPWEEYDPHVPGLVECEQLLSAAGFEGNTDRVFSYWHAGGPGGYQHQSRYFYEGSMSMRLHATLGSYPMCAPIPDPHLYQTVVLPTEVYTISTVHVRGQRLVAESGSSCCSSATDPDDVLYLQMKDSGGGDLGASAAIVNGGVVSKTWGAFEVDMTDAVSPYDRPGEEVQVYFYAIQDALDFDCTFFYLDALECEACTGWPIPDDEVGTASIGGVVKVLEGGYYRARQGVDVWAYSAGGEVYHTYTIQEGAYHFYNVPPGSYTIYSEDWIEGGLKFDQVTVTVAANERNYSVNLRLD